MAGARASAPQELEIAFGRRRMVVRSIGLTAAAWIAALVVYLGTGQAIPAVAGLLVIFLGGFAYEIRRAARLGRALHAVRREHPEWTAEQVLEEGRRRMRSRAGP